MKGATGLRAKEKKAVEKTRPRRKVAGVQKNLSGNELAKTLKYKKRWKLK